MTLVKLNDPMRADAQIPCILEDRLKFKIIAAKKGITMTRLFHEWVEKYGKEEP